MPVDTIKMIDYLTMFSLAATLNAAFLAVEYSKSYAVMLSKNVFKFKESIDNSIREILSKIEKNSLPTLIALEIEGKSTASIIEQIDRDSELLNERADTIKKQLYKKMDNLCYSKCHSQLSLLCILFCLSFIVLIPFNNLLHQTYLYLTSLTFFSFLFLISGWIIGEKEKGFKYCNYSSFLHIIIYFFIISLLALVSAIFLPLICVKFKDDSYLWYGILFFSTILPYFNFFAFYIILRNKTNTFKDHIDSQIARIDSECNLILGKVQKTLNAMDIHKELQIDTSLSNEQKPE